MGWEGVNCKLQGEEVRRQGERADAVLDGSRDLRPWAIAVKRRPEGLPHRTPVPMARGPIDFAVAGQQRQLSEGLCYEMGIDSFFGAAHAIRPGGPRHTHSFRVQVTLVSDALEEGMMRGFRGVSNVLSQEVQRLANRFYDLRARASASTSKPRGLVARGGVFEHAFRLSRLVR